MFAVTAVHPRTGMTATVFFAKSRVIGHQLVLLDFEVGPLTGTLLNAISTRLGELAGQCRVRHAVRGVFFCPRYSRSSRMSTA
jgi:hypothetical protein